MFIAFEGIDGSGKTTVSNLVVGRLKQLDLSVKHLRAEGKFVSAVSESIRSLARDSKNLDLVPEAEFLLYVARDVQLIEEALRGALPSHDVVLADRFLYTAEVLGRYGRGLSADYVAPVLAAAARGLEPDMVILVDVDPVLARARRKASKVVSKDARPPSRKGLAGVGLAHRQRRGYLELAARAPERWVVVKNEDALEQTVDDVVALIEDALANGARSAIERRTARRAEVVPPERTLRTPDDALGQLLAWLDQREPREPQVAAYVLSGLWGAQVDPVRIRLAERVPTVVLAGLSGLDDEVSWSLRETLCSAHPEAVARSLAGLSEDDPRVFAMRVRLESLAPAEVVRGLAKLDDERAWALRERLWQDQPDAVMASLAGLGSERAWALRARWLDERKARLEGSYELAKVAARSVHGVDDEAAWRLRELARAAAPVASLASIGTLTSEPSWHYREQYLTRATKVVMETLRKQRDPRAWRMREAVATECKEAVDSIAGLDDPEAWSLRESLADLWPSTVVKTLGGLADGPRGMALVARQLARHGQNVSLLKHGAAIALGCHRFGSEDAERLAS